MSVILSARDMERMVGVRPELVVVVATCATLVPSGFMVIEGVRTLATQAEYVSSGASQTMNSRHLTGHAVDLGVLDANGDITWEWPNYEALAVYMKDAAKRCAVPIEWGGDWKSFPDGPHFQLTWEAYPAEVQKPELIEALNKAVKTEEA